MTQNSNQKRVPQHQQPKNTPQQNKEKNNSENIVQQQSLQKPQIHGQELNNIKNSQQIEKSQNQQNKQLQDNKSNSKSQKALKSFDNSKDDTPIRSHPNNIPQKITSCNCKKSKCLKMYCQCFANEQGCKQSCRCLNCQNTKNASKDKKNPQKFGQEADKQSDSNKKSNKPKQRSCNCKKSFCLKKYCQCFNANVGCGQNCKCQDCKNNGQNFPPKNDKLSNSMQFPETNNPEMMKLFSEVFSEPARQYQKVEEPLKRKDKWNQEQIEQKLTQILKLVPQDQQQTVLDFLAYCLS